MKSEADAHIRLAVEMLREAEMDLVNGFPRGSANGAYLAMEHAARAMLLADGQRARKHQEVIGLFGAVFAKSKRVDPKFHRYLIDDFDLRNVAEYDPLPEPPVSPERAVQSLEHAREFIAMAKKFLEEPR